MNYKDTLNLPRTDFPMKANLALMEPGILAFWEKLSIYHKLKQERKGQKKFILHDGPPYANGLIHIGHALNKILKDIVVKFKAMEGFDVPFIVGWDCHGLPVEHQLLKELKLTKADVDTVTFRKKAKDFALKFVDLQRKDFIRLGVFSDWNNPYLTLNKEYEYSVLTLLKELTNKGYVYRGSKPVNWCPTCETALAEAEVEYSDKQSHSVYFLFETTDKNAALPYADLSFLVWTTTPWTLISNVAVAVHPDLEYGVYEYGDKNVIFAKELKEKVEDTIQTRLKEKTVVYGSKLEGIILNHPFINRKTKVVNAGFVSKEDGSGCVHIAPGHGQEDFSLVKKYNLDIIMPVNEKGVFTAQAPEFTGKDTDKASLAVIDVLKENKRMVKNETITHSYPHCWRCKNPVIFRTTPQWFLNVDHDNLRQKLLDTIDGVTWIPGSGIERMRSMILTRPDWCLSRQRLWGIPIPAVKCRGCGEIILEAEIIERAANLARSQGSDSWFTSDITAFLPQGFICPACKTASFTKECDILDVWFESGASFAAVVKNNPDLAFPADMYLEGSDQHRGWFQVSLIPSVAEEKKAPFKTILTHGFVVDGEGKKMSKSLGNVISPQEIVKQYGVEILRLWAASSDYAEDIKISPQLIKQLVDMYRKIRNTIRFILGNIWDFVPQRDKIAVSDLLYIDKFMLAKTALTEKEIINNYNSFAFHKVCKTIFNFCNLDLSSFYLDILKDRLYTYSQNSYERKSAQNVLSHILKVILKAVSPILSFTAEEAFSCFHNWQGKKESVFLHRFDQDGEFDLNDDDLLDLLKSGGKILALRDRVLKEIEKKREESLIGSSLEAVIELNCQGEDYLFYKDRGELLREVFIVSEVTVKEGKFNINVDKAKNTKCARCWNFRDDVSQNKDYPDICQKCVSALKRGGDNAEKKA
ncbi:MAG: isoleucine--tRNA ligase [Candidatus Omnitrophota bacterium]